MALVHVKADDTLVFDENRPETCVELPALRNILANASVHCDYMYDFLGTLEFEGTRRPPRAHRTSVRLAVTLRDSLDQMVQLLEGRDLNDGKTKEDRDGQ